ncbi:sensor histidine kinase [Mesorhizobium loti]|nr:sensor histidine kinase [Mesorhizobium loti]PLP59507.1 sensor histidine kinase [Mesorhizobium loti]
MTAAAPYSLRRRLLFWLLVPLIAIGLIALLDTWREAIGTANAASDRVLAGSALAIAERVVVSEEGTLEVDIPYVALEMLTSAAQDRVFYRVDGPPGTFITGYETLPTMPTPPPEKAQFSDGTFRGEPIRLAALARSASTGVDSIPFVVTVAETTIARTQLAQTILLHSALRLAVLIGGAALIAWFAVNASLQPLYRLRAAIGERSPDDLHPIDDRVPGEVRGLVETVNSFMVRLGAALSGLRNFTGNASHQLRTPMTIVRTQLALASRARSLDEAKAAAQTADMAIVRAEHVLSQLLLLARIEAAASNRVDTTSVDLSAITMESVADRIMRANTVGADLGFEGGEPVPVQGEALLIGELAGNLVDNAIAYAGSGAEITVRVSGKDEAILEVEDNGPGIPPDKLAAVRARFSRGAGADKPGSGLGLPIVEEIAELFGGRLTLETPASGKGLIARVTFPRAPAPNQTEEKATIE